MTAQQRSGFAEALGKNAKLFQIMKTATPRSSFGFDGVPDGKYVAQLSKVTCGLTKDNNARITYLLTIAEAGPYAGQQGRKSDDQDPPTSDKISDDQKSEWMAQTIKAVGIEFKTPTDIIKESDRISAEQPFVEITLKTKNDFQNIYINKLLTPDDIKVELADLSNVGVNDGEVTGYETESSGNGGPGSGQSSTVGDYPGDVPEEGAEHTVISERDTDGTAVDWFPNSDGSAYLIVRVFTPDIGEGKCQAVNTEDESQSYEIAWDDLDAVE